MIKELKVKQDMKIPNPPRKPVKPKKPPETIEEFRSIDLWNFDGEPLAKVIEENFPGISLADLEINQDWKGYDGGTVQLIHSWQAPNPKYNDQMVKYLKKLEEYEEARRQYKLDVEKYKEDLALWHKEQLEKLDG